MEEINKNDISHTASKIGRFVFIVFLIEVVSTVFINDWLANLLHSYEPLSKVDLVEIDMLIRTFLHALVLIIVSLFTFKVSFKDMFSNKDQVYEVSLVAKAKLTVLFISIAIFSAILSSFIMLTYDKHVMSIPMPETTLLIFFFGIFVAPIMEEVIYRGIILNQLKGCGYLFSIIISSIYFGSILGFAYVLTGNIKWSIIIHFSYNLILQLIEYSFLPLFPGMSISGGRLIIGIILLLIFLITTNPLLFKIKVVLY